MSLSCSFNCEDLVLLSIANLPRCCFHLVFFAGNVISERNISTVTTRNVLGETHYRCGHQYATGGCEWPRAA